VSIGLLSDRINGLVSMLLYLMKTIIPFHKQYGNNVFSRSFRDCSVSVAYILLILSGLSEPISFGPLCL